MQVFSLLFAPNNENPEAVTQTEGPQVFVGTFQKPLLTRKRKQSNNRAVALEKQSISSDSFHSECHTEAVSNSNQSPFILQPEPFLDMERESLVVFLLSSLLFVELIVRPSRARRHTSSCVWKQSSLSVFINKPHTHRGGLRASADGLQGETKMDTLRPKETWRNERKKRVSLDLLFFYLNSFWDFFLLIFEWSRCRRRSCAVIRKVVTGGKFRLFVLMLLSWGASWHQNSKEASTWGWKKSFWPQCFVAASQSPDYCRYGLFLIGAELSFYGVLNLSSWKSHW